jgi:hypothetical protein
MFTRTRFNVFQAVIFFHCRRCNQSFVWISPVRLACYMPHTAHPHVHHSCGIIWGIVKIMKVDVTQNSPAYCSFLPLGPKYFLQHHPIRERRLSIP